MCGRYTLTKTDPPTLIRRFGLPDVDLAEPARYNIAPTDRVLTVRESEAGTREAVRVRWGLLPQRDIGIERPLINARAETLAERPLFRELLRKRRCLVPADGFYEWRSTPTGKRPVWISLADGEPFAFAGIWTERRREGTRPVQSCAIVTCSPNELIAPVHDRMPVILAPAAEGEWLAADRGPDQLTELLRPYPADALAMREVGKAVNDIAEDGPHLLEPPLRLF